MKVLAEGNKNPNLWKIKATCSGRGWAQTNKPCGALLEVSELDILKRKHTDISGSTDIYYGFRCPICGCFTEIPFNQVPDRVQNQANFYK